MTESTIIAILASSTTLASFLFLVFAFLKDRGKEKHRPIVTILFLAILLLLITNMLAVLHLFNSKDFPDYYVGGSYIISMIVLLVGGSICLLWSRFETS